MEIDLRFITAWAIFSIALTIILLFFTPLLKNKLIKIISAILAPIVAYIVLSLNREKHRKYKK